MTSGAGFATRQQLEERALQQTGCSDFGPGKGWREGLDRLLAALEEQALPPGSVARLEQRFTNVLASRLAVQEWLTSHPTEAGSPVEGPVIIIGLPRTATTALLNLLSRDSEWRYVREWEATQPVPPPDIATERDDPRAIAERDRLAHDNTYAGMHIHDAGGPVDDAALLRLSFRNQELGVPAFDYSRWWRDCDMTEAYAYHHRMLGLLQSRRPPNRWLIKAPWHNFHLDELFAEYPDARFIMTHRDPGRTIPSVASLLYTSFSTWQPAEEIDRKAIGNFVLEHLSISIQRVMAFRRRHGADRVLDVDHQDFTADPLAQVGRIYTWLGRDLRHDVRERMMSWSERNTTEARGGHSYSPADFGLEPERIFDAFAEYTD
jgi:hypothetical protein